MPCGPINDIAQVFAEPQTQPRELALTLHHGRRGDIPVVRSPPMLGEHTNQVLAEVLGKSPQDIQALRERSVV